MKQAFYKFAVANPGHVEWYCSLKLSMAVQLTAELLTQQMRSSTVPGFDAVKARVEAALKEKLGNKRRVLPQH